jgi:hypothetical protein
MKTVFRASGLAAVALIAGLALAALCKLIYDLFNGYSVVPNLLADLGSPPSAVLLQALQFVGLAAPAFLVGNALLKAIPGTPGRVAFASAVPWVALCVWGVVSGMFGEHGELLLELTRSSYLLLAAPLLMTLAVPFGLWLAYRRKRADA